MIKAQRNQKKKKKRKAHKTTISEILSFPFCFFCLFCVSFLMIPTPVKDTYFPYVTLISLCHPGHMFPNATANMNGLPCHLKPSQSTI